MSMSLNFVEKINHLYQSFIKYDATQCDRIKRYRNIEPDSAQYLAMQIRIQQSKKVLEIGTSTGYSTLWLADAVQVTEGRITTLEIDEERTIKAKAYAQDFKLDHLVDFWVGDAFDFLAQTQEKYDFILLDAERDQYLKYWPYLSEIMNKQGGVLFVDNVISHTAEVKTFLQAVKNDQRFLTTTLSLGAGLFMITFKDYIR
ncbi:O-methyltransferase [Acinetobacter sichuanensis]|uniref:Methyltransferase domain-containing protein n=1 Tax=Acinetobacter sichuanensis TaxID=2136183 RepID=A0A371YMC5_9GAMM|nr:MULTISPECIES: class I SAM-dependent methyltransferase [Acinetobacter]MDM1247563.1 class I SAM-dependent methyltransferase [Acinetobacter sp. R933-2]MDM1765290.1 class I SAM-dependent methyltransferase [Acinetobacter sp. 226-1]MDM1768795.1 class I SAM-dependent methyltransferase [Acinetobacter sp. 226-4]RFC82638.1 methyltransferase domain-containing protein [Acinetobacter sichuanensis]